MADLPEQATETVAADVEEAIRGVSEDLAEIRSRLRRAVEEFQTQTDDRARVLEEISAGALDTRGELRRWRDAAREYSLIHLRYRSELDQILKDLQDTLLTWRTGPFGRLESASWWSNESDGQGIYAEVIPLQNRIIDDLYRPLLREVVGAAAATEQDILVAAEELMTLEARLS